MIAEILPVPRASKPPAQLAPKPYGDAGQKLDRVTLGSAEHGSRWLQKDSGSIAFLLFFQRVSQSCLVPIESNVWLGVARELKFPRIGRAAVGKSCRYWTRHCDFITFLLARSRNFGRMENFRFPSAALVHRRSYQRGGRDHSNDAVSTKELIILCRSVGTTRSSGAL